MVNLVMAMVLSQFTEYATGNAEYSLSTLIIMIMFTIEGIVYQILGRILPPLQMGEECQIFLMKLLVISKKCDRIDV